MARKVARVTTGKLKLPPPFEQAAEAHEREIMRYLVRMTQDREDALDLFQETWLRAYRAYPQLASIDGLRPWLFRIAGNLCRNRARDAVRRSRVIAGQIADDGLDGIRSHLGTGAQDGAMQAVHLKSMIAKLPDRQARALKMRKFEGLEYDEIAQALNCSPESARAGVYQALKKLREEHIR